MAKAPCVQVRRPALEPNGLRATDAMLMHVRSRRMWHQASELGLECGTLRNQKQGIAVTRSSDSPSKNAGVAELKNMKSHCAGARRQQAGLISSEIPYPTMIPQNPATASDGASG